MKNKRENKNTELLDTFRFFTVMSEENFVYDYKKRIDERCSEDWFRTDEQVDYFENE